MAVHVGRRIPLPAGSIEIFGTWLLAGLAGRVRSIRAAGHRVPRERQRWRFSASKFLEAPHRCQDAPLAAPNPPSAGAFVDACKQRRLHWNYRKRNIFSLVLRLSWEANKIRINVASFHHHAPGMS